MSKDINNLPDTKDVAVTLDPTSEGVTTMMVPMLQGMDPSNTAQRLADTVLVMAIMQRIARADDEQVMKILAQCEQHVDTVLNIASQMASDLVKGK